MDRALNLPWLLVATPQLASDDFRRAVVLVVETSSQGAMGFVINRPIQMPLASLVKMPSLNIPDNVPAWYGGPVERSTGIILHNRPEGAAGPASISQVPAFISYPGEHPGEGLALSSSEQTLEELAAFAVKRSEALASGNASAAAESSKLGLYPYRFLVGYAGWGPGQLEDELRQGAWIQVPATHTLLFHTPWKDLWDTALGTTGASPKTLAPVAQSYLN